MTRPSGSTGFDVRIFTGLPVKAVFLEVVTETKDRSHLPSMIGSLRGA